MCVTPQAPHGKKRLNPLHAQPFRTVVRLVETEIIAREHQALLVPVTRLRTTQVVFQKDPIHVAIILMSMLAIAQQRLLIKSMRVWVERTVMVLIVKQILPTTAIPVGELPIKQELTVSGMVWEAAQEIRFRQEVTVMQLLRVLVEVTPMKVLLVVMRILPASVRPVRQSVMTLMCGTVGTGIKNKFAWG